MRFLAVVLFLVSLATALPHDNIINQPDMRDVGLFFTEPNYQGASTFMLENPKENKCYPINVHGKSANGLSIQSVQICVPTWCTLYTGENCTNTQIGDFAVAIEGPGDVPKHDHSKFTFKSYRCGAHPENTDVKWETVAHGSGAESM